MENIDSIIDVIYDRTFVPKDVIRKCIPSDPKEIECIAEFLKKNYALVKPRAWDLKYTNGMVLMENYIKDIKNMESIPMNLPEKIEGVFRFATYNVHFWLPPAGMENNIDSVLKFMRDSSVNVVALQEAILPIPPIMEDIPIDLLGYNITIQPIDPVIPSTIKGYIVSTDGWWKDGLYDVIRKNGYDYISQVGASTTHSGSGSYFGNAILSNLPITKSQGLTLSAYGQGRGAAISYYRGLVGPGLVVISVHLDVFDESGNVRLEQIKELMDHLDKHHPNIPTIIMGDLNAMKYEDYTDKERAWLENNNQGNPLDFKVIKAIEDRGYVDVFDTKSIKFSTWTARRVDYIFIKGIPLENIMGTYVHYSLDSDHLPLIVDIKV
jgi:endonuclease/exonuclease/phosphatase family metal-dependent hydrolase